MPIEFAYQLIKDFVALAKMEEGDPIVPGTLDANKLVTMGMLKGEDTASYLWCAPRNVFAKAEAANATHEIVWVTDHLRRIKCEVVRNTHDGKIDLILIRKKERR